MHKMKPRLLLREFSVWSFNFDPNNFGRLIIIQQYNYTREQCNFDVLFHQFYCLPKTTLQMFFHLRKLEIVI